MWFISYNNYFDTLICSFSNIEHDSVLKKENLTLLLSENKLIGLNIKNPNIDKTISYKLVDDVLNKYVYKTIKSIINNFNVKENNSTIIICKIIKCEEIPNSHLKKCTVDIKSRQIQIITNSSNASVGMYTVVALDGSYLKDGTYISNGKIKGEISDGMFCSKKTLGIDKFNNEGILDIKSLKDQLGNPFFKFL